MAKVIGNWPRTLTIAAALAVGLFAVAVGLFSAEILRELSHLRANPRDNVQWSLAQLEVEELVLLDAIRDAEAGEAGPDEVRRRFDILYSRARVLGNSDVFSALAEDPQSRAAIADVRGRLDAMIPTIDAPDDVLMASLLALRAEVEALRPVVRRLVLDGVRLFARASDAKRTAFARLIGDTAAMTAVLIGLLVLLVLLLLRQTKVSIERAEALQLSAKRFSETIEACLNAVIIADGEGRIVHFNRAAETTFGYTRRQAEGARLGELIVPNDEMAEDAAGTSRAGEKCLKSVIGRGRVEFDAVRASGEVFPVELSLSQVDGPDGPLLIAFARDITDRVEAERELMEARDKALAAARAKSEFLAVMSHEMRTPLNGVMAILDLLRGTELDDEQRRYVETAIHSGEVMQRHVDDVLDVNRIESGKLELAPEPTDLAVLIEEIVRINEPAAAARGNAFVTEVALAWRTVMADRHRLGQVLLNLVGNAVKFTERGRITVSVRPCGEVGDPHRAELAVADTGVGIAVEDRERIFEDFVTLDPSYSRAAGGYGIGLGICRRIVEAMGGEIAVDGAPGEGSCFRVRLTLPPAPAPSESPRPVTPVAPVPAAQEPLRVLVVEDNETNRFAVREMLRRQGCVVAEAHDGLAGLARAERERFDLVLMDISMPRLDGLEATRRIRAGNGLSRDVPIVALTAHALPEERDRLRETGMQDLLTKPLRQAHLECLMRRLRAGDLDRGDDGARCCEELAPVPAFTAAPEGAADEPVDWSVIAELAGILDADDFHGRLEGFREEMRTLPAYLRAVWRGGDIALVRERAHAASGSAALFGAVRLTDVLATLEDTCIDDEPEFVDPLLDELEKAVSETETALRDAARRGLVPPVALPAPALGC